MLTNGWIKGISRIGLITVMIAGCTSTSPPKWVAKNGYGEDKAFYGVGLVQGVKNESLAWEAAQNRARADLAKTFETYTAYLMRDYAASTTAGDFTRNTEEQNIERAVKTFAAVTLSGVRQVDRWYDEKKQTYYVLAKLDLTEVKDQLGQAKELNGQVRDFVRKNADRLFDKLEKEEAKRATQ